MSNFILLVAIIAFIGAISNGVHSQSSSKPFGFMHDDVLTEGDRCFHLIRSAYGYCTSPEHCGEAIKDFRKGIQPQICSYSDSQPIICCPSAQNIPSTLPPNRFTLEYQTVLPTRHRLSALKCDQYSKLGVEKTIVGSFSVGERINNTVEKPRCALSGGGGFIVGGTVTKLGEFPHMTAIGWRDDGDRLEFKCGGSLISYWFVLSAAHCSSSHNKRPSVARFGEQNIQSDDDGASVQDIAIESVLRHPQYKPSSKYFDIALFKLERRVIITDNVRPACLWQRQNIEYTSAIATGWGLTRDRGLPSNELLKVSLKLIDNYRCDRVFQRFTSNSLKNGIIETQLCAGDDKDEKDTCSGDSGNYNKNQFHFFFVEQKKKKNNNDKNLFTGGPLQVQTAEYKCIYHLVAITSFGIGCGQIGVYTR